MKDLRTQKRHWSRDLNIHFGTIHLARLHRLAACG